jgi:hypothetical protein
MKVKTNPGSAAALTLVEVLVVIAAIGLLVLTLLPRMLPRACCKAQRISCVNNLKQVGLAFKLWAGDNADRFPMRVSVTNGGTMEWVASGTVWPHFQVISNELNTPKVINCPADAVRFAATNWTALDNSNINYFVGVDTQESKPTMLLAGDDNLEIRGKQVVSGLLNLWTNSAVVWTAERHNRCGNVAMGDGSTMQIDNVKLREALANTGVATNRLAIP